MRLIWLVIPILAVLGLAVPAMAQADLRTATCSDCKCKLVRTYSGWSCCCPQCSKHGVKYKAIDGCPYCRRDAAEAEARAQAEREARRRQQQLEEEARRRQQLAEMEARRRQLEAEYEANRIRQQAESEAQRKKQQADWDRIKRANDEMWAKTNAKTAETWKRIQQQAAPRQAPLTPRRSIYDDAPMDEGDSSNEGLTDEGPGDEEIDFPVIRPWRDPYIEPAPRPIRRQVPRSTVPPAPEVIVVAPAPRPPPVIVTPPSPAELAAAEAAKNAQHYEALFGTESATGGGNEEKEDKPNAPIEGSDTDPQSADQDETADLVQAVVEFASSEEEEEPTGLPEVVADEMFAGASETLSGAVGEIIKDASQHYPNKETQAVADAAAEAAADAASQGTVEERVKNLYKVRDAAVTLIGVIGEKFGWLMNGGVSQSPPSKQAAQTQTQPKSTGGGSIGGTVIWLMNGGSSQRGK